ncbi:RIO-like kinase [Favolaschia claudopus]|uniref:RIO-like kinase n=1 Tax=Favolaschia claudopus TaxID=2862362 RepID=A0AAW0CR01_9AGAR
MARWKTLFGLFCKSRPPPPIDACTSESMSTFTAECLLHVTRLQTFDPRELSCASTPNGRILDFSLVRRVLQENGPDFEYTINAISTWQWTISPPERICNDQFEELLYPYLLWALYRPASEAVAPVLRALELPFSGYSTADALDRGTSRGPPTSCTFCRTCDNLSQPELPAKDTVQTAHEVKRAMVLTNDKLVLLHAYATQSWSFRSSGNFPIGRRLLRQVLAELELYGLAHIIVTTETHYVLVHLKGHILRMSPIYDIHNSASQAEDVAELVLQRNTNSSRVPSAIQQDVRVGFCTTISSFPVSLFRPDRGVLCIDGHSWPTKLVPATPGLLPSIPLQIVGFDAFIHLVFTVVRCKAVAKVARKPTASTRLKREYDVYDALGMLQGISIPKIFGMFRTLGDSCWVLIMSHQGMPLGDFNTLSLKQRRRLLSHLIRIHEAGVEHGDMEPRNVVLSEVDGPFIVDFDLACVGHQCPGTTCVELLQLASELDLDLEFELGHHFSVGNKPIFFGDAASRVTFELSQSVKARSITVYIYGFMLFGGSCMWALYLLEKIRG